MDSKHPLYRCSASVAVMVDYAGSAKDMLEAGIYEWISPKFSRCKFPSGGHGSRMLTIEIASFGTTVTTSTILRAMVRSQVRPATVEELLALGGQNPELLPGGIIVALGSIVGSCAPLAPCLFESTLRSVDVETSMLDWPSLYRFAAVRDHAASH